MGVVGRFEIVERIISGACETFSARDPNNGDTVLLHLLEAGGAGTAEERFRVYAPSCPGAILESGTDSASQRVFVVTEYPKDRKALMLWVRQLSFGAPKPAAAPKPTPAAPPKPAPPKPAAPPPAPPAELAATKMLDPSAILGGVPRPAAPKPKSPPAASSAPPAPAPPAAAAPEGATKMLDASALASHLPPALAHPPGKAAAPPAARPPAPAAEKKPGAFTQAFELPPEHRRPSGQMESPFAKLASSAPSSAPPTPAAETKPEGKKPGRFTAMFEAYALRQDAATAAKSRGPQPSAKPAAPATPPVAPPPAAPAASAGGETKAFSSAALASMLPKAPLPPRVGTPPPPKAAPAAKAAPAPPAPQPPTPVGGGETKAFSSAALAGMLPKAPAAGGKSAAATTPATKPPAAAPPTPAQASAPAHAVLTPSPTHVPTSSLPSLMKKPAHAEEEPKSNTMLYVGLGIAALIVALLIVYFFVLK